MKKTAVFVAVGFALVWLGVALIIQGDVAKIREAERRADAIHKKNLAAEEAKWKATLERLDLKPNR